jgi:preprotein translocase subunit SecG
MMDTIFSWNTLWWALMLSYIPISFALVTLVLLQQGKGGGLAGALGGGGGDNVFGAKSAQTMPVKLTYIGAGIFLVLAIMLSIVSGRTGSSGAAPDLVTVVDGAPTDSSAAPTTELEALGLGTGVSNGSAAATTVATPEVAPVTEDESTNAAE